MEHKSLSFSLASSARSSSSTGTRNEAGAQPIAPLASTIHHPAYMQQQNIVALTLQLYVYTEHAIKGFKMSGQSAFSGIWYVFVAQICSSLCRIWTDQVSREQEHFQWWLDKKGGGKTSIKKVFC